MIQPRRILFCVAVALLASCDDSVVTPSGLGNGIVAYAQQSDPSVRFLNLPTLTQLPKCSTHLSPSSTVPFAWFHDGQRILFVDQQATVTNPLTVARVYDITSRTSSPVFDESMAIVAHPAVSKVSGLISYRYVPLHVDSQQVVIIHPNGSGRKQLTHFPSPSFLGPSVWSPTENLLLFTHGRGLLYSIQADGTGLTVLSQPGEKVSDPAFSPNGLEIVFRTYQQSTSALAVISSDGQSRRILVPADSAELGDPCWSPDGQYVAYYRKRGPDQNLYLVRRDSTGRRQLTHDAGATTWPQWTNDGRHILFKDPFDIWSIDSDGSNQRRLTTNGIAVGIISDFRINPSN